jgi:hydroxyquinol 1,2-dioxygenase
MRNFDETNITTAVLDRVGCASSPRIRKISEALVRHLHALVREVEPTQDEWMAAIEFLTRCGHLCSDVRKECILLSDALSVSMLVDAINHRVAGHATETTILGPFYVQAVSEHSLGDDISGDLAGEPFLFEGSVTRIDGTPIAEAIVNVWHADGEGFYDVQRFGDLGKFAGRARFRTDEQGRFWFRSIMPASVLPDTRRWPGG